MATRHLGRGQSLPCLVACRSEEFLLTSIRELPIRRTLKNLIKWQIPHIQAVLMCRWKCKLVPLWLVRLSVVQGHWKLPQKLIWSPARWRIRQFPQILVLLEAR